MSTFHSFKQVSVENLFFSKMPNPMGFWALLGFPIFYLNEQLGSLLIDLAH